MSVPDSVEAASCQSNGADEMKDAKDAAQVSQPAQDATGDVPAADAKPGSGLPKVRTVPTLCVFICFQLCSLGRMRHALRWNPWPADKSNGDRSKRAIHPKGPAPDLLSFLVIRLTCCYQPRREVLKPNCAWWA